MFEVLIIELMYQQVPVVGKECGDQGNERAAEGACISTTTK